MSGYCKVLIIDDELITRQGIKHMMAWESKGFQIVGEASNGQEGLEIIDKLQPDIVLADIVMPILNGIDFSVIMQEKYPHIQLIILSSYDNFEYVKSTLLNGAVDYILKPTLNPEILLESLMKAARNILGFELVEHENISVKSQLERYFSGYQELMEENSLREYFPHMHFRILGIDLKKTCGNNKNQIMHIRDWLTESFDGKSEYVSTSILLEEKILCYIFNYRLKDEEKLIENINSCVYKTVKMQEHVFFILGGKFSQLHEMKQRYIHGIRENINHQFYFPTKNLVFESECSKTEPIKRFDYETYTQCLNYKKYEEALQQFRTYTNYVCEKQFDEYLIKNLTKNLLYNFLMEIEKYDIPSEELKQKYFLEIDNSAYVDQFLNVYDSIINTIENLIKQKINKDNDGARIIEIKYYIKEHYNEMLDLAEISKVFNLNYNYLSSYFSQHTREGFSGYLNKIRIEKACELLKNSTLTIAEISSEVGYTDQSYYCRVFKKISGVTPSQYKRHLKQE